MSELDRRLLDGIRLTSDAYDSGRIDALREACEVLAKDLEASNKVLVVEQDPVARTKARGANEAVGRILRDFEARIERAESKRGHI